MPYIIPVKYLFRMFSFPKGLSLVMWSRLSGRHVQLPRERPRRAERDLDQCTEMQGPLWLFLNSTTERFCSKTAARESVKRSERSVPTRTNTRPLWLFLNSTTECFYSKTAARESGKRSERSVPTRTNTRFLWLFLKQIPYR